MVFFVLKKKELSPCPQRGRKTPLGFFKDGTPKPKYWGVTVKFVVNFLVVVAGYDCKRGGYKNQDSFKFNTDNTHVTSMQKTFVQEEITKSWSAVPIIQSLATKRT